MSAPALLRIPMGSVGSFGLAVVDYAAANYSPGWQAPDGKTLAAGGVKIADYETKSGQWACQLTALALTSTPNIQETDRKGTFCQPPGKSITVGDDSFNLELNTYQDSQVADGLQAFLYAHRTRELFWYASFDGPDGAPRAIGRTRATMSTVGGDAWKDLEATLRLPVLLPPDIEFGTGATTIIVTGAAAAPPVKGATKNGDQFPAEATITASDATNAAKLAGLGYIATPTTAWTTGQSFRIAQYQFHWTGTAFAAGPA